MTNEETRPKTGSGQVIEVRDELEFFRLPPQAQRVIVELTRRDQGRGYSDA